MAYSTESNCAKKTEAWFDVGRAEVLDDIPGSVLVDIGNDTMVSIAIEVVWSPPRCKHCMIFGHFDVKCGKVVCDDVVDSVLHKAPVELGSSAQERDGGSLNDVVDSVFVCDELLVEGAGEQIGIVCDNDVSVPILEDRVARENGVQSICAESPNKFVALSVVNEEDPNSLYGFQVVEPEPELGSPKRGRIDVGGVAELMQQLNLKLRNLRKGGDSPWAIAGDFNIIFKPEESFDFNGSQGFTGPMNDFRNCLDVLDVLDHHFLVQFSLGATFGMRRLKTPLRELNIEAYGDISNRVQAQQVELERLQACMMNDLNAENVRRVKAANIGLRDMLKAEEQFFRQKSCVQHVKE
ncbi:hypothetical protein GQ457_15G000970 [Hibiscus cannabinus]